MPSDTAFGLPLTVLIRVVGGAFNVIAGSTSTIAAITDVCDGDSKLMTESLARFTGYAGCGILVGPLLGARVYRRSGNSVMCVYLIRTLICFDFGKRGSRWEREPCVASLLSQVWGRGKMKMM